MRFFLTKFRWLMLVSGLLTCTMFLGLFAPARSIEMTFGEPMPATPFAEIIIRNWSALIGLSGVMLIYGAFVSVVRKYSLVISGMSKVIFIALVLTYGRQYLSFGAGTAVVADTIMVVLFAAYVLLDRGEDSSVTPG